LSFNIGVELGQLAFIAVVFGIAALARRISFARTIWPYALRFAQRLIGILAAFRFFERLAGFIA
jgi:hypothetical protein